jgi:hypothetical protein
MKALSLKLREDVFRDIEQIVHALQIPRNTYINRALEFYTKLSRRKWLKRQLRAESTAVQQQSLDTLKEFELFEDDLLG